MRPMRWVCGLVALGAGAAATHWYVGHAERLRLRAEVERLERERHELEQVAERLSSEQRVADVMVLRQERDDNNRVTETEIDFVELDRAGHALPPRRFCLPGRVLYFDALVIKFDEALVAAGDPLRGKSILLFRRVFSEQLAPEDGRLIDRNGDIPDVFRVDAHPSEFERKLWQQFWSYVADRKLARQQGIRVAQGEAVYAPMTAGERWSLTLESDGGLNLTVLDPAPSPSAG